LQNSNCSCVTTLSVLVIVSVSVTIACALYHFGLETAFPWTCRGESRGEIAPPKSNESYFIYHDFVQFGKQYSQYNSENSIRNIIRKAVSVIKLDYKLLLKSPPPILTGWIPPVDMIVEIQITQLLTWNFARSVTDLRYFLD